MHGLLRKLFMFEKKSIRDLWKLFIFEKKNEILLKLLIFEKKRKKKSMAYYENDWYLETITADYENYLYWKIVWEIMKFIYIWKQKI